MDDVFEGCPTCNPEIPLFAVSSMHDTSNPSANFFASFIEGVSVPGFGVASVS